MIYLDHCATTALSENVKNDILKNLDNYGNPSSLYSAGLLSKKIIKDSRRQIAECINCRPEEIYFTSGASEANSWALQQPFYCESYEHHSVLNNRNRTTDINKCNQVSFMYVNNEIGFVNDISELRKLYKDFYIHTDATQAIGNINVDVQRLNIDTMSFSGHKFHAPKGVGCLYINSKSSLKLKPIIYGGKQESGIRGGTENILGISAMGIAIQDAYNNLNNKDFHCKKLRTHLINRLKQAKINFIINETSNSISSILNISIKDIENDAISSWLDFKNIYISSGSACNSGSLEPSEALKWFGVPKEYINGTLRISFDLSNTIKEIDVLCNEIINITQKISK